MRKVSRKRKPAKNVAVLIGLILLIFIICLIAFFFNDNFLALKNNSFKSTKLNVLVIGYDSLINGPPRADTIILASIDLKSKEIGLLSIPRDTRVSIPGHGVNRVNASHAFGGAKLTVKTLESFMNVNIDYYLETDFTGFARIIDALGGVSIDIEAPLHYVDKAGGLYINLPAGMQKLDGKKALQYVRYREPIKGDIGRVERQQKFLKAMFKRMLNPDIIIKLPGIYKEVKKAVNTNIPFQDISPFVHLLKDMDFNSIETVMLPGEPQYIDGASYWIADQEELAILVKNLILSKEYIRNSHYKLAIYNGNGVNGLAGSMAEEMKKYGFRVARIADADHYNYQTTLIRYFDEKNKRLALNINKLFDGKIEYIQKEGQNTADIEIILGADILEKEDAS
jgi:LCP family protein required for cell wall assembly